MVINPSSFFLFSFPFWWWSISGYHSKKRFSISGNKLLENSQKPANF
jgi:hypothetical protein